MDVNVVFVAIFVAFLWGVAPVIHKHVLKRVDPKVVMITGSFFYVSCLVLFWLFNRKIINNGMKQLSIRDVCFIGFTSMITGFFASLIYFHILKKHESYVIAALIYSSPVFTLLISYFVLKEKVSYIGVAGVILIVSGVIMLALNEKGHKHEEFLNAR